MFRKVRHSFIENHMSVNARGQNLGYTIDHLINFLGMATSTIGSKPNPLPPEELADSIMFHKHHFDIKWFHIYIYLKNKAGAINGTMERSYGKKKNYKYHFYYEYMVRFHNRVYRCDRTLKYGRYEMNRLEDILDQFKYVCKDFLTPPPAPHIISIRIRL